MIDDIISWFRIQIENNNPIPPSKWLDEAMKLNVLLEDVDEQWAFARLSVNQLKAHGIEDGLPASTAKIKAEATAEYKVMLDLEAKRDRIQEFIRLAKKRATLKEWE